MKENHNISSKTDAELVQSVKLNNCDQSMREIIRRHEPLVSDIIHKFCRRNPHINVTDLLQEKYTIINNAVSSFNSLKKTKITTWIYYVARFHCLNINKNADKLIHMENNDIDIINAQNNKSFGHESFKFEDNNYIFNILEKAKDKRIIDIFKKRYFDGNGNKLKPWTQIAKEYNLSITRVIALHEEGLSLINRKIKINKGNNIL